MLWNLIFHNSSNSSSSHNNTSNSSSSSSGIILWLTKWDLKGETETEMYAAQAQTLYTNTML
jgi:hypothetical protein